jgi:hypothetical protein
LSWPIKDILATVSVDLLRHKTEKGDIDHTEQNPDDSLQFMISYVSMRIDGELEETHVAEHST